MNQFRRYFYISIMMAVAQFIVPVATNARMLTLDQCKDLALKNNKQIAIARMKQNSAKDAKDIARTQYLPKVSAVGSYLYTSKEISLLNDNQKATLGSLGTTTVNNFNSFVQGLNVPGLISDLAQQGIITAQQAAALTKGLDEQFLFFGFCLVGCQLHVYVGNLVESRQPSSHIDRLCQSY